MVHLEYLGHDQLDWFAEPYYINDNLEKECPESIRHWMLKVFIVHVICAQGCQSIQRAMLASSSFANLPSHQYLLLVPQWHLH